MDKTGKDAERGNVDPERQTWPGLSHMQTLALTL